MLEAGRRIRSLEITSSSLVHEQAVRSRMSSQLTYDLLWFGHPALQAAVALVMCRRKLYRAFPVFFSYVLAQILIFATTYPIYRLGNYAAFFYSYWIGSAVSVVLGFKVIHEIFLDVFRPYHTLKDLGTMLFRWAGLVMLLVALVVAVSSPSGQESPLVQGTLISQRCVRVIQCGLVLFLLVFSRYLGVSWRQHSFGIALGFGSFAASELALVALFAGGILVNTTVNLANMAVYNIAIVVWLCYFVGKSPAREISANLLRPQRWEQSLMDIQHPVAPDSLIPMFEGMVDRALSRTNGSSHSAIPAEERAPSSANSYEFEYQPPHISSKS
jgi:hypothetical protein